jgi:putative oxidoreductase
MFSIFTKNTIVPLFLRLTLAAIFLYHGLSLVNGPDTQWGANWMKGKDGKPLPDAAPAPVQLAVAWGQLVGGLAMLVGFLTRLAALGLIAIMAGAIALVHWPNGFDIRNGGFEYNFAIIMMCLCLLLGGPGPIAIDRIFRLRRRPAPPAPANPPPK